MTNIWLLTKKEFRDYFNSPIASVFATVYILLSFWIFFSDFFVRGQTDCELFFNTSLFLFPIFLPALTMNRWSDEKKSGTLEILLTLPLTDAEVVIGKFLASFFVLALTLLVTLILPLSVSLMGDLDWGPVIGGYLGLLLLGAVSLGIGLFLSSLTESAIIAFILSFLVLAFLHLVGSPVVTNHVPETAARFLIGLGTASHFESLSRGVIDVRDILYYFSSLGLFLYWNLLSLESRKWEL